MTPSDNNVIVGFATNQGHANGESKTVLFRAVGPSMGAFGLKGDPAPKIEVFNGGTSAGTTTGWADALSATFSQVGAFPLSPGSADVALVRTTLGGTVIITESANANTVLAGGSVLAEIYDLDGRLLPRLTNMSARAFVGPPIGDLLAGFTVTGTGTKQLLVRGIGPSLVTLGVNSSIIPLLQLYDRSGRNVASVQGWDPGLLPTFKAVGAFPLLADSNDAAMVVTVAANDSYTVRLSVVPQPYFQGGPGLLEIYEVP